MPKSVEPKAVDTSFFPERGVGERVLKLAPDRGLGPKYLLSSVTRGLDCSADFQICRIAELYSA